MNKAMHAERVFPGKLMGWPCFAVLLGLAVSCPVFAGPGLLEPRFSASVVCSHRVLEAGATATWSCQLLLTSGAGESLGLAAFSADLQQYPGNPAPITLTPGTRGPGLANFDRPLGIANPVPGQITSSASAFGGTVLDTQGYGYPGLIQIGGAQNTFGMPGTSYLGSSQTPVAGVGLQAQGQVIASGSFIAPTVPGEYVLYLENVYVNYLQTVGGPGVPSEVASATVFVGDPVYFTVAPCLVDYNHDTVVNSDDLGDYITDYFNDPPIPGPGGYASACPENDPPYDQGYKANFTLDGSGQCFPPNSDNLGDFITAYFDSPC